MRILKRNVLRGVGALACIFVGGCGGPRDDLRGRDMERGGRWFQRFASPENDILTLEAYGRGTVQIPLSERQGL